MILTTALVLELVRHSLTGSHCRYREYIDGVPTETYITRACSADDLTQPRVATNETGETGVVACPPRRYAQGRLVRCEIVHEAPLQPYAYDYDAATGELLRRVPLFFNNRPARVFDPNPVATLNDPTLQDRNDAASAVPESAYTLVDLPEVAESGPLRGPHVTLTNRQPPDIAPPDAAGSLLFNREQDGFEDVNAYFHVDRTQRYLQSLGYVGQRAVAPYSIEVDAHAAHGADNSFFLPSFTRIGYGALHFGEGGTDDAEDADLVVHEYTHALLEWIAPGTFAGTFASESRALAEGLGDYWAFSQHVDTRLASGRDPFCFADWDARCWEDDPSQRCVYPPGTDCLRRLDSTRTMADYDRRESPGVEHRNGTIWSSALRELHLQIGRTTFDPIVIESLFDLPPTPTFASAARRLIEADRLLYRGAHGATICAAMRSRGILAACDDHGARGERTLFQSLDRALPIPDNTGASLTSSIAVADSRAIERLFVRVDIAHPARGDLRLELIAPDGTVVVLQQIGSELTRDIHTTFGLTTNPEQSLDVLRGRSAAGTWRLVVRDLRVRDAGVLLSWGLLIQFAGDEPVAMRPRSERTQTIPVVTHLFGVGATPFASDVRIANASGERREATLIFTRSGEDGRTSFQAIDLVLEPGQTVAFEDVVQSAFHTTGSGSLEVLGDVVVMSRTYASTERFGGPASIAGGGTLGQQVPPQLDMTSFDTAPLVIAPIRAGDTRVNIGVTEVGGSSGRVSVAGREFDIAPFSHVQFAATIEPTLVKVLSGDARVVAYASQIDNSTNDPMFIPALAEPQTSRRLIAPAASVRGAIGSEWISDLWIHRTFAGPGSPEPVQVTIDAIRAGQGFRAQRDIVRDLVFLDVVREIFHPAYPIVALSVRLPPGTIAMTRVRNGGVSQFVPLREEEGPVVQQLLFIESSEPYRTNIGIVSDDDAIAEVVLYDAAGNEVAREILSTPGGLAQMTVAPRITHGRAAVRFLTGRGRAYASLIDNRTGDATYIDGQ